jgi:protein-disulfide isomerase
VTAVVEFSDYECPFCARAHAENRLFFAGRPDLQLLRKQFPLDPTCNPAVKRAVHLTACELARAAICARAQGKFDAMDDALFANQRAHRPVAEIARSVGLDLDRFGVCLDAPETTRRLQAEIEEGIRAEVNATPTYVVDGHSYAGEIPPGVLPPRPGGG